MTLPATIGRFEVLAQLGRGGMGVVYKVRAPDGQLRALKLLHAGSLDVSHRFKREFRAASRLHHDNIVAVHDLCEEPVLHFTMEYVDGTDVVRFIHNGRLGEPASRPEHIRRLFFALGQILKALDYIHARGIVHRDLKPDNILVNREGAVKITDFGLAKLEGASSFATASGTIMGTLGYAAPEQVSGGAVDARTDLYALGCILFQVLTGHFPFATGDIAALIRHKLLNEEAPSPLVSNPSLDPGWETVTRRLLYRDANRRYQSIAELVADLRSLWSAASGRKASVALDERQLLSDKHVTLRAPHLVGRDREIARLTQLLDHIPQGQGRVVLVRGAPGSGKTRLVEELRLRARARGIRIVVGTAASSPRPYGHFVPVLEKVADRLAGWRDAEVLAAVGSEGAALRVLVPRFNKVAAIERLPAASPLPPLAARDRDFRTIVDLFRAVARRGPVLLVLEDFHSADDASVSLFEHLARSVLAQGGGIPVIILVTYRAGELARSESTTALLRVSAASPSGIEKIRLRPLDTPAAAELIASMLGGCALEPAVAERLAQATDGSPMFLEQLVRRLAQDGALVRHDGGFRVVEELLDRVVPPERKSLTPEEHGRAVAEVLGRLSTRTRRILELGALAGPSFRTAVLAEVTRLGEDKVFDALEEALRADILKEPERADEPFSFRHKRYQEELLAAIPADRVRELHRRILLVLEGLGDAPVEELCRHAEAGEEVERAIAMLPRVAQTFASKADNHGALKAYERALELLEEREATEPGDLLRVRLRLEAAEVALLAGEQARALKLLGRARELAEARSLGPELGAALVGEAGVLRVRGGYAEARARAEQALQLARSYQAEAVEARALDELGGVARRAERWDEAMAWFRGALPLHARLGNEIGVADCLINLAIVARRRNWLDKARLSAEVGLALHGRIGNRRGVAFAYSQLGSIHQALCEYDEALRCQEEALGIDTEIGHYRGVGLACSSLGTIHLTMGEYSRAESRFKQAYEVFTVLPDPQKQALTLLNLGHVAFRQDAPRMAKGLYVKALEGLRRLGDRGGMSEARSALAVVRGKLGQTREAVSDAREALDLARAVGLGEKEAWASLTLARLSGDLRAAEHAVETARRIEDRNLLFQALHCLGLAYRSNGRTERALEALREGVATVSRMAEGLRSGRETFLARPAIQELRQALRRTERGAPSSAG